MRVRLLIPAATAILLACALTPARGQAATDLGKRTGRSKYALGSIYMMHELADGRVIASDTKEGVFRTVDFGKGDVGLFGTQGDDENDYRRAAAILEYPGDSIGLVDAIGRKVMHVSAQGSAGAMTPIPGADQRLNPFATDAHGNAYFRAAVRDSATNAPSPQSWVTRLAPGAKAPEQVVPFRTRADDQQLTGLMPFRYADAIAVRRDGLVARVVADTYRVIWYRDGKETARTAAIPYQPIVITDAEKQAMQDSIVQMVKGLTSGRGGNPQGATMSFGGAPGGVSAGMAIGAGGGDANRVVIMNPANGGGPPPTAADAAKGATMITQMNNLDPAKLLGTFPAAKPPIPNGNNVAMFDAEGRLWVARSQVRGDVVPHYDVIDEQRGVVGHVNLPTGTRLVGFGHSAVYLARADEGTDWLERYAAPKM